MTLRRTHPGLCPPAFDLSHAQRGFTAIEIAMVATVIAIFALIVLPLFRNRVEEAKIARTKADLISLQKAETLAQADTGFYLRLEDLDNVMNNINYTPPNPPIPPAGGITIQIPPFVFPIANPTALPITRRALTLSEWANLAGLPANPKFKGPYISSMDYIIYGKLKTDTTYRNLLRSVSGNPASPIYDLNTGQLYDSDDNHIPVDPWGNPYLYFPPTGETSTNQNNNLTYSNVIYSLGPDGLPGNLPGTSANDFLRGTTNGLGNGDDLMVQF
ncbi:MAG: prepilin-type N-terminal cleavage/methylation domain-containing protein [bacterium]